MEKTTHLIGQSMLATVRAQKVASEFSEPVKWARPDNGWY